MTPAGDGGDHLAGTLVGLDLACGVSSDDRFCLRDFGALGDRHFDTLAADHRFEGQLGEVRLALRSDPADATKLDADRRKDAAQLRIEDVAQAVTNEIPGQAVEQ